MRGRTVGNPPVNHSRCMEVFPEMIFENVIQDWRQLGHISYMISRFLHRFQVVVGRVIGNSSIRSLGPPI